MSLVWWIAIGIASIWILCGLCELIRGKFSLKDPFGSLITFVISPFAYFMKAKDSMTQRRARR